MEVVNGSSLAQTRGKAYRPVSVAAEQVPKRRKLRKGTFSCRECKRRKVRCEIKAGSGGSCASCQRYGLQCISQEHDEAADESQTLAEERIGNIEHLVQQLRRERELQNGSAMSTSDQQRSHHNAANAKDRVVSRRVNRITQPTTPAVKSMKRPCSPPMCLAISEDLLSRCRSLSGHLSSILPASNTAFRILESSQSPYEMMRHSPAETIESRNDLQAISTHPIVFARKLLQLALGLQTLEADLSQQLDQLSLDAPARDIADRYVENARYVTSQDILVNSAEGLETLVLEAVYQVHAGNLDRAWLIFRRAVGMAQLMGLSGLDDTRSQSMWFRLVQADRSLSLILGRPCAPIDDESFASEQSLSKCTPAERLDRIHVAAHGRIISRNHRLRKYRTGAGTADSAEDIYAETQDIDLTLKNAARLLPLSWWAIPDVQNTTSQAKAAAMFSQILAQLHHFYVLLFLHEPYFVEKCSHLQPPTDCLNDGSGNRMTYNKHAIVSASRDILARFDAFRKFPNVPASNSSLAHKAYLASMALLLVHIEGHKAGHANLLEHQRPTDLRMISDGMDSVEEMSRADRHVLAHFAKTVRRLMEVEEEAAGGAWFTVACEDCVPGDSECGRNVVPDLHWSVPFFGVLRIIRQSCDGGGGPTVLTAPDDTGAEPESFATMWSQDDFDFEDPDFWALIE